MAAGELRVICGPTGAGKSAIAMALAERFPATIVSADSRQIYRGFDVGTAKPSLDDRRRVPHETIDVAEPTERYSAARWADEARAAIARAAAAGRTPVVVGGTGFYVRALVAPLFAEPPLDPAARSALAAELDPLPLDELRRRVARLDPARAHLGRAQLLRAIEVATLTGTPLSEWHSRTPREPSELVARYLVVDPGPVLAEWIATRARDMLANGWLDETVRLQRDVPADAPAWNASGYGVVRRIVAGDLSRDAAVERIAIETRQYAKRQRTWLRHQLPSAHVTRLDPRATGAREAAARWWSGEEIAA